ncbi:MAG: PilW family protein [Desulfatirhabdiaceae bacterium]
MRNHSKYISGYSLIELMIAMTIGLVILGAIGTLFVMQQESTSDQARIIEMQENLRVGMDIMSRELLMAGYDPYKNDPSKAKTTGILTANANSIRIAYAEDENNDGDTDDSGEYKDITYTIDTTNKELKREINSGGAQPLALNINSLSLSYDSSTLADIRSIEITLTAQSESSTPRILQENIRPRNLGLASTSSASSTTTTTTVTTSSTTTSSSSTDTSTTTTTDTTTSTADTDPTTSSTTTATEPTTSSSTSSSTTTTTLGAVTTSSTTTTTLPCNLSISLHGCKPSGNGKYVYATSHVENNGVPEDGATVNWRITDNTTNISQSPMQSKGDGNYGGDDSCGSLSHAAQSASTYNNKWSGTVSATASKDGCTSVTASITVTD